jgi:hypothetical protein
MFAFASATLLLSLLFAPPGAGSADERRLLYAIVNTNFDSPPTTTPPTTLFDPPTLVAARLGAIDDGEFRLGVIGSTRAQAAIALAICPPGREDGQGGVAYTIANAFSPQNQLANLDLRTGAATLVGSPIAEEFDIMAMTCSSDGTLYTIGQLNPGNPDTFNSLYKLDRETGSATRVGSTGVTTDQQGRLLSRDFSWPWPLRRMGRCTGSATGPQEQKKEAHCTELARSMEQRRTRST